MDKLTDNGQARNRSHDARQLIHVRLVGPLRGCMPYLYPAATILPNIPVSHKMPKRFQKTDLIVLKMLRITKAEQRLTEHAVSTMTLMAARTQAEALAHKKALIKMASTVRSLGLPPQVGSFRYTCHKNKRPRGVKPCLQTRAFQAPDLAPLKASGKTKRPRGVKPPSNRPRSWKME